MFWVIFGGQGLVTNKRQLAGDKQDHTIISNVLKTKSSDDQSTRLIRGSRFYIISNDREDGCLSPLIKWPEIEGRKEGRKED
jgi:hypothetical protein